MLISRNKLNNFIWLKLLYLAFEINWHGKIWQLSFFSAISLFEIPIIRSVGEKNELNVCEVGWEESIWINLAFSWKYADADRYFQG